MESQKKPRGMGKENRVTLRTAYLGEEVWEPLNQREMAVRL